MRLHFLILPLFLFLFIESTVLPNASADPPTKIHSLRFDNLFNYDSSNNAYENEKLRVSYTLDNFTLTVDINSDEQNEYFINFIPIANKKHSLSINFLGSLKKTVDGEFSETTYDFAVAYKRFLGKVPILGDFSILLYQYNSLEKDAGSEHKFRSGFLSDSFDVVAQVVRDRDKSIGYSYYAAYHNSFMNICLGKAVDPIYAGILLIKKPFSHVSIFDYDKEAETYTFFGYSAFKNSESWFYSRMQIDDGAPLFILGDKGITMPLFPSYLAFGDINHYLKMTFSPVELRITNQLGYRFSKNFGLGGGVLLRRLKPESLKGFPVLSAFFRVPIGKQSFFIQCRFEEDVLNFLASAEFHF